MKRIFLFVASTLMMMAGFGQQMGGYQVYLNEISIPGSPGVQSFVSGQWNGKWLIIGGRTDGLHQRQPFAAFLASDNNTTAYVVDPATKQTWSASLSSLPTGLVEQLQSTNMEFEQVDSILYIIGGYGYSATAGDHTTFPNISAVNVRQAIDAIINGNSLSACFRQITDSRMQVTGGYLDRLDNTFYLVGGQKFIGRYNPMGPNQGPGFVQEYTDEIRKFEIIDNGSTIQIANYSALHDTANLHRRDYNMCPQIFPDGHWGLTVFSGVFQPVTDLPWLNTVDVDSGGYVVNNTFNQYLNQYHTAHMPLFDSVTKEMHTVFFGGMSRYTLDSQGQLVDDPDVPFVTTISLVTRDSAGNMTEYQAGDMPALLGSGAEFIPDINFPIYNNDVLKLSAVSGDTVLAGYIVGGIESSQPNIFFINDGTQSDATNRIFEVYLVKSAVAIDAIDGTNYFNPQVFPNPASGSTKLRFSLPHADQVSVQVFDAKGSLVIEKETRQFQPGTHEIMLDLNGLPAGLYTIKMQNEQFSSELKLVVG